MERALAACARADASLEAVLARACALALREHPRANSGYRDGQIELYARVNIGLVVASGEELAAATIFDADTKGIDALTLEIAQLRSRIDELTHPERSGATFTLFAHEVPGVSWEVPLVWSGQAAALAAGSVRDAPVVSEGTLAAGQVMTLTLACDHRVLYGPVAARFLTRVKQLLEDGAL